MIEEQEDRLQTFSNENVSQSYEEDESMFFGQKKKVVKSILQKMANYQTQNLGGKVTDNRVNSAMASSAASMSVGQASSPQIKWSNQEM